MFADLLDDQVDVDIGPVDPRNLDVWSLGLTALKLLNLDELMPPHIEEGELTLEELYGIYEQQYDGEESDLRNYVHPDMSEFMTDFLLLVADMLTINSEHRPDPRTLLNNPIFDIYRSKEDVIDAESFNNRRVQHLRDIIPEKENDIVMRRLLTEIVHYHFNNVESARLAICMLYLLKDRGHLTTEPGSDSDSDSDSTQSLGLGLDTNELLNIVIALAAAIFDTDVVDMSRSKASKVLKALDYDLLQPVNHPEISQLLAKLFSTV